MHVLASYYEAITMLPLSYRMYAEASRNTLTKSHCKLV